MVCLREIMAKKKEVENEPFGGVQPNKVPEKSMDGKPTDLHLCNMSVFIESKVFIEIKKC